MMARVEDASLRKSVADFGSRQAAITALPYAMIRFVSSRPIKRFAPVIAHASIVPSLAAGAFIERRIEEFPGYR
jgi:hypothetical protein